MPDWTLGNICSYATRRIGNRADLSLSDCTFWANQAQDDLIRDVPELRSEKTQWFSVSSGDSLLTIPADLYEVINFSFQTTTGSSSYTLRQVAPEWADAQGYYPVGPPEGYFLFNDRIQLWPSADSSAATTHASSGRSFQLRYRALAAGMAATTAHPSVHTAHRLGIVLKLEEYLHDLVGNHEEAAAASARYLGFVASLRDANARRHAASGRFSMSLPHRRSRSGTPSPNSDDDSWLRR